MPSPSLDTALLMAAQGGHPRLAQRHLTAGASPQAVDANGYTPLALAVMHDHLKLLDVLLPVSDVNAPCGPADGSVLMLAASNLLSPNGPAILMRLLAAGANPGHADRSYGHTALHAASKTRRPPGKRDPVPPAALDAFQALLDGSIPSERTVTEQTPLMIAAALGEDAWVERLLPVSDPSAVTSLGWSALMGAAGEMAPDKLMRLLAAGADAQQTTHHGRSAAHVVIQGAGTAAMLDELVRRGATIHTLEPDEPILGWAALRVDPMFLDIVARTDPEAVARDGEYALVVALSNGSEPAIAWLEARLPDPVIARALTLAPRSDQPALWDAVNRRRIAREKAQLDAVLPTALPAGPTPHRPRL